MQDESADGQDIFIDGMTGMFAFAKPVCRRRPLRPWPPGVAVRVHVFSESEAMISCQLLHQVGPVSSFSQVLTADLAVDAGVTVEARNVVPLMV